VPKGSRLFRLPRKIWFEEIQRKFAEGYRGRASDEFWGCPLSEADFLEKLADGVAAIKQTTNKQK
jgi:hypothetical protein